MMQDFEKIINEIDPDDFEANAEEVEDEDGADAVCRLPGWVLLARQFTEWEWYTDLITKAVFLHILLNANYKDKRWRGLLIKRGQWFTSIGNLAKQLKLTRQQTRTALEHLKSTHEITIKATSCGILINVEKYRVFQDGKTTSNQPSNQPSNQRATNEQPTSNQRATSEQPQHNNNNNNNNNNKDNNGDRARAQEEARRPAPEAIPGETQDGVEWLRAAREKQKQLNERRKA